MEAIKKFVVIGPESTGKSTLCARLAEHYHTLWVPEYAREYLEKNGTDYTYDDLLTIAKGQIDLEEAVSGQLSAMNNQQSATSTQQRTSHIVHRTSPIMLIDTDMYVMKVWCEYVFNKCHSWILNQVAETHYDGYLLCNTDMPWVKDNLREYPDLETRNKLYLVYKEILKHQPVPWTDISGNYKERFEKAVTFINDWM